MNSEHETLMELVDALPAELNAQAHILLTRADWRALYEGGSTVSTEDAAELLADYVTELNNTGEDTPWPVTSVMEALDVELVKALLAAGLRADQLYIDQGGYPDSLVALALTTFENRVRFFGLEAPGLPVWAARCADIVQALIEAGGPTTVNVWLGDSTKPVTDLLKSRGIVLRGSESWQEIAAGLLIDPTKDIDRGEVLCSVLDFAGISPIPLRPGFQNKAREACLQAAISSFYELIDEGLMHA